MYQVHIGRWRTVFCTIFVPLLLVGCITMSGTYTISAYDSAGHNLTQKAELMAEGKGIYTVINALCSNYPGAIVVIKDVKTGEELKSESPHNCR